jgi:phenylpropionate dioxygenase-like ring-hydroxylating dioxygenase large terminal subunit
MNKAKNWTHQVHSRLAHHLENGGSTDRLTNHIHRLSLRDTYLEPSRDNVARHAPFPICPSSLLRRGHTIAETHPDGTPIFVYRDLMDGTAKAYVNQCRHRGSPLVKRGTAPETISVGNKLVCPYHAWTYDASTGTLRGVPGEKDGFPCLEKSEHSLVPVECLETAGGIWVGGRDARYGCRIGTIASTTAK